jgi:DNA adenine methylase
VSMVYAGSKRRIAKEIIPIMLKDYKEGQYFYDLFAGGFNLIDKIPQNIPRVANEINAYITELFIQLQRDDFKLPEHIGEEKYKHIQKNKEEYPKWLVGYVGFNLSFGAQFLGTYARTKVCVRDHENEAQRNLNAQRNLIKCVKIYNLSYNEVPINPNSIIYCDIPYKNTTGYKAVGNKFNYDEFYNWCLEKNKEGHKVFISEYYMPESLFESVWEKEITSSLNNITGDKKGKKGIEKLWVVKKQ